MRRVIRIFAWDLMTGDHVLDDNRQECVIEKLDKESVGNVIAVFDMPFNGSTGWAFETIDIVKLLIIS